MYNLMKYSDNYSKTCGNLYLFCRYVPKKVAIESESF